MASNRVLRRSRGARSETGYVRSANEDRMDLAFAPFGDVYIVSDGMGGYRGGALAAEITVRTLKQRLAALAPQSPTIIEDVRKAFLAANQEVFRHRRPDDPETRNMGATGVAMITHGSRILVGHVGDSRAYHWRRGRGLTRLTRDHTRVQQMLDDGVVTPQQAAVHPDASLLDRAIGHQPTVEVDVSDWLPLRSGDMVLLCTDGLCGYVDDAEIGRVLHANRDPQVLADRLVDAALKKGGEDNVTVQLVRFGGASAGWLAGLLGKPAVLLSGTAALMATVLVVDFPSDKQAAGEASPIDPRVAALMAEIEALRATNRSREMKIADLTARVQALEGATRSVATTTAPPVVAASSAPIAKAPRKATEKKTTAVSGKASATTPTAAKDHAASAAASAPPAQVTTEPTAAAASATVPAPPPPSAPAHTEPPAPAPASAEAAKLPSD